MSRSSKLLLVFLTLTITALISALIAGCTTQAGTGGKIVISYTRWGDPAEVESTRELIAEFMVDNPDVLVRTDVVSWQQYWMKMATAVVTGTAQDVWLISPVYIEQYAAAGHLLDLMPFVEADTTFNEADYFPHAFDSCTYAGEGKDMQNVPFRQGKLYAFTRDYNTSILYYNKDHFDAGGVAYPADNWTWQDFADAAAKLTVDFDGDGIIDQWGSMGAGYTTLATTIGGKLIDPERKRCNYSPRPGHTQVYDAILFNLDLIYKYKASPPPTLQVEEYAFVTGKASMIIEGAWEIRNYNRSKNLWDIAKVPLKDKNSKRVLSGGGVAHCVYSGTKHPEAAWRLVKFLSSEKSQRMLGRSGTSVPVHRKAAYSEDFLADFDRPPRSSHRVIYENLEGGQFVPQYTRGYLEFMKISRQVMAEVFLGVKTAEEGCREIDEKVNKVMAAEYGD
jgi:multiple sugar transport system substrate-binding protein